MFRKIQYPSINTRYNDNHLLTKQKDVDKLIGEFDTLDYETILTKHQIGRQLSATSSISITNVFAARIWISRWMYTSFAKTDETTPALFADKEKELK